VVVLLVLVGLVWMFVSQGVAPGLVFTTAVAAVAIVIYNPWEQRPQPAIALEVDGEDADRVVLGRRRALDVAALVEDARHETEIISAGAGLTGVITGLYLPPRAADHDEFKDRVGDYLTSVREWLVDVEVFLDARARILVGRAVQSNPARVDASKARVGLSFPPGFRRASLPTPPAEPKQPEFPRHRSPLAIMGDAASFASGSPWDGPLMRVPSAALLGLQNADRRTPSYDEDSESLSVSWPRQTIHHGEDEYSGAEFEVETTAPPGTYEVLWTVRGENLPKERSGAVTVEVCRELVEPIRTLDELRAHLRTLNPEATDPEDDE